RHALALPAGVAQRLYLAGADELRRRAGLAQPAVEREPVEPLSVRVAPGIDGVDRRRELGEAGSDPGRRLPVGIRQPGEHAADPSAVDEVERRLARLGDIARPGRQAELGHEPEVGRVEVADELAAELDGAPVRDLRLLDAAAGAVAR